MADQADPRDLCPHAESVLEGLKCGAEAIVKCPVCPVELYRGLKASPGNGGAPAGKGETKPQ